MSWHFGIAHILLNRSRLVILIDNHCFVFFCFPHSKTPGHRGLVYRLVNILWNNVNTKTLPTLSYSSLVDL